MVVKDRRIGITEGMVGKTSVAPEEEEDVYIKSLCWEKSQR